MRRCDLDAESARRILQFAIGPLLLVLGLDKFVGLLADWPASVSAPLRALLPVDPAAVLPLLGLVEMAIGASILSRWSRVGAYAAAVWSLAMSGNLALTGHLATACGGVALTAGACALAQLGQWHALAVTDPSTQPVDLAEWRRKKARSRPRTAAPVLRLAPPHPHSHDRPA
jgi:hypothetical protein